MQRVYYVLEGVRSIGFPDPLKILRLVGLTYQCDILAASNKAFSIAILLKVLINDLTGV